MMKRIDFDHGRVLTTARATLYKSTHDDQPCMVKKAKDDEESIAATKNEAAILGRLNHEHIIKLLAYRDDLSPTLDLEYLPNGTLEDLINAQRWSFSEDNLGGIIQWREKETPYQLMEQFFKALMYLHQLKIIHRDLKPENILISADKTVKLADFEFAHQLENEGYRDTPRGTLIYLAPECLYEAGMDPAQPKTTFTISTDMYAAAIVLFATFTGHSPYIIQLDDQFHANIRKFYNDPNSLDKSDCPKIPNERLHHLYQQIKTSRGNERPGAAEVLEKIQAAKAAL